MSPNQKRTEVTLAQLRAAQRKDERNFDLDGAMPNDPEILEIRNSRKLSALALALQAGKPDDPFRA